MRFWSTIGASAALTAFALSLGAASAEDGPVDLHPAKTAKTAPKPKTAAPSDPSAPVSSSEAIKRANAYLDSMQVMSADFVQIGSDSHRSEGKLYVQRPGKMRFQYAPPDRLDVI